MKEVENNVTLAEAKMGRILRAASENIGNKRKVRNLSKRNEKEMKFRENIVSGMRSSITSCIRCSLA